MGNAGERVLERAHTCIKDRIWHIDSNLADPWSADGLFNRSAAGGDYKVVRELPENGGELQYRIKSGREAHERVVNESDLETI